MRNDNYKEKKSFETMSAMFFFLPPFFDIHYIVYQLSN